MKLRRPSPVMILIFLKKYAYWLLVPLLRGLWTVVRFGDVSRSGGIFWDSLVVGGLMGAAVVHWMFSGYALYEKGVYFRVGVMIRQEGFLSGKTIAALSVRGSLPERMLLVRRLTPVTALGRTCRRTIPVYVSKREYLRLRSVFVQEDSTRKRSVKGGAVLMMSLFESNPFWGAVLVSVILVRLGNLLSDRLTHLMVHSLIELSVQIKVTADQWAQLLHLAHRISLAGAFAAALVMIGWLWGVLKQWVSCYPLEISVSKTHLRLERGRLTKQVLDVKIPSVLYTKSRQTLLMLLLKRRTVFLGFYGAGNISKHHGMELLLPFAKEQEEISFYKEYLSNFYNQNTHVQIIRPDSHGGMWGYLFTPTMMLLGAVLLTMPSDLIMEFNGFFPWMMGCVLYFLGGWLLILRICSYRRACVIYTRELLILRTHGKLSLQEMRLPKKALLKVNLRQNPFQKMTYRCDLVFTPKGKAGSPFAVRNLPLGHACWLAKTIVQDGI